MAAITNDFKASLPRYVITVRVTPELLPWLRYAGRFARIEQIHPPDADSWSLISIQFDVEEEACAYVLEFGAQMEVVEPPELRHRVLQGAKQVIDILQTISADPNEGWLRQGQC